MNKFRARDSNPMPQDKWTANESTEFWVLALTWEQCDLMLEYKGAQFSPKLPTVFTAVFT